MQDWRAHYEQMHTHKESIDATLSDTKVYLDKLHQEISKTLEKVASREKYINNQVDKKHKLFECMPLLNFFLVLSSKVGASYSGVS